VGLLIRVANDVPEELIRSLKILYNNTINMWHAIQGREGVELLIFLLALSSNSSRNVQWPYFVCCQMKMMKENPLVQIPEIGSSKVKKHSKMLL